MAACRLSALIFALAVAATETWTINRRSASPACSLMSVTASRALKPGRGIGSILGAGRSTELGVRDFSTMSIVAICSFR